ncbi:PspC domain-containing protein [Granulicoccus sp. GXG6511]|uniref:PspC domain-containing protein n=1 Tax=Granulicoccus sp. GXG6511 TaxID=3381351 RepID=UPI003D7C8BBA
MNKKLERSTTDKMLGGVCGGLAEYLGVDATIVRIITAAIVLLFTGVGPIAYILAWVLIPAASGKAIAGDWTQKATNWYNTQQANKQAGQPYGQNRVHNPEDLR